MDRTGAVHWDVALSALQFERAREPCTASFGAARKDGRGMRPV